MQRPFWPPCALGATSKAADLAKRKHIKVAAVEAEAVVGGGAGAASPLPRQITDVIFDVEGTDGGDTLGDETSFSSTGTRGGVRKGQAPQCEVDSNRASVRKKRSENIFTGSG